MGDGAGKTLYVSDLDGTLLQSNERTSGYTNGTINRLVAKGMLFSYATARSYQTAHKVTEGLDARIPLIIYNGAMIVDNVDGVSLRKNFFEKDVARLFGDLFAHDVFPIVYSFVGGVEKFSFLPRECTRGMKAFLDSRRGDPRTNPVGDAPHLTAGEVFYITCIDEKAKLEPLYEKYKGSFHCVFQVDLYTGEQWLEIMPKNASKARAVLQLKEALGCERLVVFGDGKNDMDMFRVAEEAYAVENGVPELKEIATGIIGGHDEDGVARWLGEHYQP